MFRRVFNTLFLTSVALLVVTVAILLAFGAMPDGGLAVTGVILTLAIGASAGFSALLAMWIVRPVLGIDPARPDTDTPYEELRPMLERLSDRDRAVSRQMEELERRRQEFDTLTGAMDEALVLINTRAEIVFCNARARTLFGVTGDLPRGVLNLRETDGFREAVRAALSGRRGEEEMKTEEKTYHISVTPVCRESGIDGAVLTALDVTESEARERLRREFTANISHEMKTPLTSISGFAELIGNGVADGEDARRFAGRIHADAQRMITLVGDIIRLSQLDGGEIPFDELPVDLAAVARDVTERLQPFAASRGVTLTLDAESAPVRGNRQTAELMLHNLVENGIHYHGERDPYVRVTVKPDARGVLLRVEDNGIGIPPEAQNRVFERFYRVDKSHSRELGGTGLGLSIVKHAAAYHGAALSLESESEKGTAVTLVFPALP